MNNSGHALTAEAQTDSCGMIIILCPLHEEPCFTTSITGSFAWQNTLDLKVLADTDQTNVALYQRTRNGGEPSYLSSEGSLSSLTSFIRLRGDVLK